MDDPFRRQMAVDYALRMATILQAADRPWIEDTALRIDRFIASGRFDEIATSEPEAPKTW